MQVLAQKKIVRLIDANFNRAKEGLRVCEDTSRFILDHKGHTRTYKGIRHKLLEIQGKLFKSREKLIHARNIEKDVGRGSLKEELRRQNVKDIYWANSQRVKESVRVLEEFAKLRNIKLALELKKIRYKVYALERKITEKL